LDDESWWRIAGLTAGAAATCVGVGVQKSEYGTRGERRCVSG
jgi:hypothetical protein